MLKLSTKQTDNMPTYQLLGSLTGAAGIRQTLKRMAKISKDYKTAPMIRELGLKLLRNIPEKQWRREAAQMLLYVQTTIRYTQDVQGVETLQTPIQTLRLGQGDCDDQSMLLAALLMTTGKPVKFVAIGPEKGVYNHVLVQTRIGGHWLWADPIMRGWPLGKGPKYKSMMVQNI